MEVGLKTAARLTGKSRPTLIRAIQAHTLSARRNEQEEWRVDVSELERVYTLNKETPDDADDDEQPVSGRELTLLREMLADRDRWLAEKEQVIADLRRRLDAEGEERRRTVAQLTGLLTDQRPEQKTRAYWWQRSWRERAAT